MKNPVPVTMAVPGRHQASNALAAAAVGLTMRVPPAKIRTALESFQASSKRMEVGQVGGVTILNDTYNANPDSTIAALHTLASMRTTGKRIAVLGDMLELGSTERGRARTRGTGRRRRRSGLPADLRHVGTAHPAGRGNADGHPL